MATSNSIQLERMIPHDRDAERVVLGCSILDNRLYAEIAAQLSADAFFVPSYRRIFLAMGRVLAQKRDLDFITLAAELRTTDELDQVGGVSGIAELTNYMPRYSNVDSWIRTIREHALRRALITQSTVQRESAFDLSEPVESVLEQAQRAVLKLEVAGTEDTWATAEEMAAQRFGEIEDTASSGQLITGTATGFVDLDYMTGGLQPGDLVYVAGRPSMGKSAFGFGLALQAAQATSNQNRTVAVFSLEMSRKTVADRWLANLAKLDLHRLRLGMLNKEEWTNLARARYELGELPIVTDDRPGLSVMQMRAKLRRLKGKLGLVLVDYLNLVRLPGASRAQESSEKVRCEAISQDLKALGKEFDTPVVVVVPLNKPERGNPKPQLSDLSYVGGYEPDVVLMIHREEYYKPDTERQGKADIIVGKQRNGPTGEIEMLFFKQQAAFRDLARSY